MFVMQMGQFIDHDITHTPNHQVKCCNKDGTFPDVFDTNKCFPIEVPSNDAFWKGRLRCMSVGRSLSAPTLKCNLESRQQVFNQFIKPGAIRSGNAVEGQIHGHSDAKKIRLCKRCCVNAAALCAALFWTCVKNHKFHS